jgi:hypothetical protein
VCQETQRPRFASDLKLRFTGFMMFRAILAALAAGVAVLGCGGLCGLSPARAEETRGGGGAFALCARG